MKYLLCSFLIGLTTLAQAGGYPKVKDGGIYTVDANYNVQVIYPSTSFGHTDIQCVLLRDNQGKVIKMSCFKDE